MKTCIKAIFLLFIYLIFCEKGSAQQDPLVSQNMFSGIYLNPATAGTKESIEFSAMHRNQWQLLNSNPSISFVNLSAPFNHNRIGLGGQLLSASYNELKFVHFHMAGSYKIRFRKTMFSAGLEAGARQYSLSYDNLLVKDKEDKILNYSNSRLMPDIGAGLYWYHSNYYLGFSARHLNQARAHFAGASESGGLRLKPHYYFSSGYQYKLSEKVSLNSLMLIKCIPSAPLQADLTITANFYQVFWTGLTWRTSKEAGILVGIVPNKIAPTLGGEWKIGYAFDFGFNALSANYYAGSHEIILLCHLKPRPNAEKIRRRNKVTSPMFFGKAGY